MRYRDFPDRPVRSDENLLGHILFTCEPATDVDLRDFETLGELPRTAKDQTGAMQCARMHSGVLGRR